MKELQSLCLDVRVLDEAGNEIELKDEDEDDFQPGREGGYSSDDEFMSAGFTIEDADSADQGSYFGSDADDDDMEPDVIDFTGEEEDL